MKPDYLRAIAWIAAATFCIGFWTVMFSYGAKLTGIGQ